MKRYVLGLLLALLVSPSAADGPTRPDGTAVQCDLPVELRMRNVGGSDGNGLCVYTSVCHAALYQGESRLFGLRAWAEKRPGGSWPAKLRTDLAAFAPGAPVLQVEGADLSFIKLCLARGYMVCSTVARGAHMVNVVYADDAKVCLLDNNRPYSVLDGKRIDDGLSWVPTQKYLADAQSGYGGGIWVVVCLERGPPAPVPTNGLPDGHSWHPPLYEWRHDSAFPGDLYLWSGGRMLGGWTKRYEARGAYYPRRGPGDWLPAALPPVPVPSPPGVYDVGVSTVEWVRDSGCHYRGRLGGPRYTLGGKEVPRQEAEALVTRYATATRLTVVGDDALRKAVLADLNGSPALAPWKGRLCVQDYGPADPMAAGVGLVPGVYAQTPPDRSGKGRVLFRLRSYSPDLLAGALRRVDPNYDPNRDPDPSVPQPPPAPRTPDLSVSAADWAHVAPFGVLSLLYAVAALLPKRKAAAPQPVPESEQKLWI